MPLGKTWREVLEDKSIDLKEVRGAANDWDYCAVGERAEALGYEYGPYALFSEVDGLRSLGYDFADAVDSGERTVALRLLDLIESRTPQSLARVAT